jgi:predicted SAM-dependent methyltransferase
VTRRRPRIVRSPHGAYLNVGCGASFSAEWTNLDLHPRRHVLAHDVRDPLPFPDESFDAVYTSHLLEHLEPEVGLRLVEEMNRVLVFGGVIRVVVPDLEDICREYLRRLGDALENPTDDALARYRWIVFELIDQLVRERPGGRMLEALERGEVDRDYVLARGGDEFAPLFDESPSRAGDGYDLRHRSVGELLRAVVRRVRARLHLRSPSPRATGESHRWMYDQLSLRVLLASVGFSQVRTTTYDASRIPHWERYRLDTSSRGDRPRKLDSLFVEAVKARGTTPTVAARAE